jgi:predicted permease
MRLSDVVFRARALFRRAAVDSELDAELRAHLEHQTAKHMAAGVSREAAERLACLELGGVEQVKEDCRDARGVWLAQTVLQDARYACRLLRKDAGFSAIAILTMALGIGASTTVFSVVNAILLKPLPYPAAEEIVLPWRLPPRGVNLGFAELPWGRNEFLTFAQQTKAFASLGAFLGDSFNLTGAGEPVRLEGVRASAGLFPSLGVAPALGRVFSAEEDRPGREHEVVLSHRLWLERFGGNRAVVGSSVNLNGAPYTVVGVMPTGFAFPRAAEMPGSFTLPREAQLWVPLALPPGPTKRGEPSELAVVGRLQRGVAAAAGQADLDLFALRMDRQFPQAKGWFSSRVAPLRAQVAGETRRPLLLMLGAVGIVLLIACSNVANLLLTRAIARARELSLRAALGASNERLVGQLVTESVLLSIAGGAVGVFVALAGIRFARTFGPANVPRLADVTLDVPVLAFALGASMITGLLFGLVPAFTAVRGADGQALKEGSLRSTAGTRSTRVRNALLVAEVALALVLVIASGLLARTFVHLLHVDAGFDPEHVVTFELTLPPSRYANLDRIVALYGTALERLRALPGVEAAGIGETVPMGGAGESTGVRIAGRAASRTREQPFANYTIASPGFFASVGTPLLRGRDFNETDTAESMPVAIVNRAMAEKFWPGEDAVGKGVGLPISSFDMTIVGVVANVKHRTVREEATPEMYVPYTQKPWPSMSTMHVAIRARAEPAALVSSVRAAISAIDPDLPLARVATLSSIVDDAMAQPRFSMLLVSAFGALALALACIGLYGAVSYSVIDRTPEIGIRLALGAERRRIVAMVLSQAMRVTGAGIGAGLAVAYVMLRTMTSFLYGIESTDGPTFAAVSLTLFAVAFLACCIPARRATRVDPMIAMRAE